MPIVFCLCALCFAITICQAQQTRTVLFGVEADGKNEVKQINVANLKVSVNKQPVRVLSYSQEAAPGHLVIALDISGSQAERPTWYTQLVAARELVRLFDKRWKITLMPFAKGADSDLPELSRDEIVSKINLMITDPKKYAYGPSQVRDAVMIAIKSYKMGPGDAVLLISDGKDNASNVPGWYFENYLGKSPVRVFGCFVMQYPFGDPKIGSLAEALSRSGGLVSYLKIPDFETAGQGGLQIKTEKGNSPQMIQAIADMASRIAQPNRIELEFPASTSGELNIEILDADGKPAKHLAVLAPKRLAADWEKER